MDHRSAPSPYVVQVKTHGTCQYRKNVTSNYTPYPLTDRTPSKWMECGKFQNYRTKILNLVIVRWKIEIKIFRNEFIQTKNNLLFS